MRGWEGARDEATAEGATQKSEISDIIGSQHVSKIFVDTCSGKSEITYSLPAVSESNRPGKRQGEYKTSIFVNGPRESLGHFDSSSCSSSSLNLSDYEMKRPDDPSFFSSTSLPDSSQDGNHDYDTSLSSSIITSGDINHSTPITKQKPQSPRDSNHSDHSTDNNKHGGSCSPAEELEPDVDESREEVLELTASVPGCHSREEVLELTASVPGCYSREEVLELTASVPGCYSQTKYNVVSPPARQTESVFVGCRDIRDPSSVPEEKIMSSKGSVRGFRNRVRAGIVTFWEEIPEKRNYRHLEHGKIIVYATSMSVVRETSDRCRAVRRLLQNYMVRYEERDAYMNKEVQVELRERLSQEEVQEVRLPHVFVDGVYIGGAEELEKLNEAGTLRAILDNYQRVAVRIMCDNCGGFRFLPCDSCHGSKKSLLRNSFTEEFSALRCVQCDGNGMRRCDVCVDQQE